MFTLRILNFFIFPHFIVFRFKLFSWKKLLCLYCFIVIFQIAFLLRKPFSIQKLNESSLCTSYDILLLLFYTLKFLISLRYILLQSRRWDIDWFFSYAAVSFLSTIWNTLFSICLWKFLPHLNYVLKHTRINALLYWFSQF